MLVDRAAGRVAESHWPDAARPVSFGSLVKPFTALAYAQAHGFRYPRFECSGGSECWLPAGHGVVGIRGALAGSCNAYFEALARRVPWAGLQALTARLGLNAPPLDADAGTLFGLGAGWKHGPAQILAAYDELLARAAEPGVRPLLQGLARSSQHGTGEGAGRALPAAALAKTGTSPCSHPRGGAGDGSAIVLYPAGSPRYALLLRAHNVTGRRAAEMAGERLARFLGLADDAATAEDAP